MAARLRPRALDELVGHVAMLGPGTPLRAAIEAGQVGSLILWGPPGVGKTSLAYVIAERLSAVVERVSAVSAGVKDLRAVLARAQVRRQQGKPFDAAPTFAAAMAGKPGQCTVLIVDEIHRFNKAQQDVLLPAVEEGLITLIGATTENPYFEVVKALVSRVEIVRLEALTDEDIGEIVDRALSLASDRAGAAAVRLSEGGKRALVALAGGDARRALNTIELLLAAHEGTVAISEDEVRAAGRQVAVQYDRAGEAHYDTISAFIKSLRGSDPDAALFYLFRMLLAGEDPKFIVRRMFIFASEDIGNADPHALMLVAAASQALEWVGLPEAEYSLAHTATYLAAAPKSNRVTVAMDRAKADVAAHGNAAPPGHVVNAPVSGMKKHGRGVGYKYPHGFPGGVVRQQYRPDAVQGNIYYEPGTEGFEREVLRRLERARAVLYGEEA